MTKYHIRARSFTDEDKWFRFSFKDHIFLRKAKKELRGFDWDYPYREFAIFTYKNGELIHVETDD